MSPTLGDRDGALLVVGGGAAAHACVAAYRSAGGDRPILLVSADDRPPYFRPALSKEHLVGGLADEELALEDDCWYRDHGVEVLLDTTVTGLDLTARTASTTTTDPLAWSDCVLATGSDATDLPIPGADDPAVLTLRHARDVPPLRAADGPIVVVGSGFVGCEAAAGLRRLGHDVTVVSPEAWPQVARLGLGVGRLIAGWLSETGVRLRSGVQASAIHRHGDALAVHLGDESVIEAACVLAAVGARPRLELPRQLRLADTGVVVTSTMQTAADHVHAIGDIATAWNEAAGRHLRVEHWGDAEAHGRAAGRALAGYHEPWSEPPGFWSTIAGETIKHVAWGDGHDVVTETRSSSGETFWYGRDGVVVGVLTHGDDDHADDAAAALVERRPMPG